MIALAWQLLKSFGPYFAIALVEFGLWYAGGQHVQKQWDAHKLQVQIETKKLLLEAHDRNAGLEESLKTSAQIIGDTYEQNTKLSSVVADRNRQLLAKRLQQPKAGGSRCPVPNSAAAAQPSNDSAAGTDAFLESAGAGLVAESARADEVSESLRACQAYVVAVQQQINMR